MKEDVLERGLLGALVAVISYVYNALGALFIILICLMILDYLTGLLSGFIRGKLSSKIGSKGIAKKLLILSSVVLAMLLDYVATMSGYSTNGLLYVAVCAWYIGNEGISIIENIGRAGVPVPKKLKNAIKVLKEDGDDSTKRRNKDA